MRRARPTAELVLQRPERRQAVGRRRFSARPAAASTEREAAGDAQIQVT